MRKDPEFFKYSGHYMMVGPQGSGKTIAAIELTRRIQQEYPKCKVASNCCYMLRDYDITHWKDLIDIKNSHFGLIAQMDELQSWFSSTAAKNFPEEMVGIICQQRKNRRLMISTSQSFSRVAKTIRLQVDYVCECKTFFGCLTIVRMRKPEMDCDGNVLKMRTLKTYFFVQDDELRDLYDTYHVIDTLSEVGFVDKAVQVNNTSNTVINIDAKNKKLFSK